MTMERKAFETEIRRIRPRLHREARCLLPDDGEAEDATQETVLKLWSMRDELDRYQSVEALAVVMVRRMALSRLRKEPAVRLVSWQEAAVAAGSTPENELIGREDEARVMRLMEMLPDAQQVVLRMKHVDGLETSEIARITGSTEEAVRQNLSRARRRILKMFLP